MNVTEQLKKTALASKERIPKDSLNVMDNFQENLEKENPIKNMLREGSSFPSFDLQNYNDDIIRLDDLLEKGPVVVTFYRGGWCPYCNIELAGYRSILDEIHKKGAELVAISPELPDKTVDIIRKNELNYQVLSDIDNNLAKKLGIVMKLTDELVKTYKSFGIDVESSNGNKNFELPVPATYVIDKDGIIKFVYANLDYKQRLEPSEVLKHL